MTNQLRINHHFEVSAERVFDAFVDVDRASQFLFATPTGRMVRSVLEPRVGGALLFVERRGDQDVEHVGTIVELERPTRFAFDFKVPSVSPDTTRVTIELVGDRDLTAGESVRVDADPRRRPARCAATVRRRLAQNPE